jgi:glycosyltransferase involved in cell wall biosynthesis
VKVLHFCSYYRPLGGAEKLLFNVLDLLEQNGVENVIVAPELGSNGPTGLRKEYFVEFLEFPFSRSTLYASISRNWALLRVLRQILRLEKPDVVHLHNQQNPFIYLACLMSGIPMVRNVHDPRLYCPTNWRLLPDNSLCPHAFGRACLTEGCVKPTLSDARQLFATIFNRQLSFWKTTLIIESRETYAMALQNGYREDQLCMIPNCTPLPPLRDEIKEKAARNDTGRNTLLFVGRASYEKGLHFLLNALPKVLQGRGAIRHQLQGNGNVLFDGGRGCRAVDLVRAVLHDRHRGLLASDSRGCNAHRRHQGLVCGR